MRPLAGPRFGFARPLGGALTVVALVGLVASSVPQGFAAGGAFALTGADSGQDRELTQPPRFVASPSAGSAVDGVSSPKAPASDEALTPQQPNVSPSPAPEAALSEPPNPSAQRGIFLASIVLLPIGLLLIVGRGLARRLIGAAREP